MLCGMIMLSSIVQARPNQQVPQLTPQVSTYYHIMEKEVEHQGKQYRFFLAIPKNTPKTTVLYSVDGNAQFPLIVNEALAQAKKPLPVIASLGYVGEKAYFIAERTHDYTPRVHGEAFAKGGNVEQFYQFMVSQLKPYVLAQMAQENITITEQSLFGHSFGGVFTLYVLFNHPDAFQRYIAASPSLWWGKGEWITQDKWQQIPNNVAVTITLGELEETPDFSQMSEEQRLRYQTRSSWLTPRQLCDYLTYAGKTCQFYLFTGKGHGSSIPDAIKTALEQSTE